ncbi:MAG: ATP synthase F1 subunit epsilon [Eubacterium sp.]|jgi:F-type H+-transporting ATPase subunit epsilon|nr:ATP synthase F1 subunit epsilon [Eubacterium sp.]MEE3399697.1 ATP synthase F1 subunit epsilon [Eubacterium sp.]
MDLFNAKIIEADSTFYSGTMQSLVVPTIDGQYGVLAHHQNLMVAVIPGLLKFMDEEGNWQEASVSDGMMRIEDGEVLILVDAAEWPYEIDAERVRQKEAAAREAMLQKRSVREYTLAEASLKRAISRMKIKDGDHMG